MAWDHYAALWQGLPVPTYNGYQQSLPDVSMQRLSATITVTPKGKIINSYTVDYWTVFMLIMETQVSKLTPEYFTYTCFLKRKSPVIQNWPTSGDPVFGLNIEFWPWIKRKNTFDICTFREPWDQILNFWCSCRFMVHTSPKSLSKIIWKRISKSYSQQIVAPQWYYILSPSQ